MTKVNVTKTIAVPAGTVWKKISAFEGIEDFSPIARSVVEGRGVGAKRSCFLPDNAEIKERLTKLDDSNMNLEYIILSGPFPLSDYVSNVSVKPVDDSHCEVSWGSQFNTEAEAEMKSLFEGFYNAIMEGLEKLLNKKVASV